MKKVGFWGNKIDYFNDTRSTDRNFKTVGGSSLYILMLLKKWKMTDMMLLLLIGINFHFQQKKSLKD